MSPCIELVHLFDEIINVLPNVLPDWRTSRHFAQILSGLRHMHRLGVVHRDIKLDNIMISQQGVLRLIDYKRAVAVPVQPPPGPIFGNTQDQRFVGAPSYVAPEVLAAKHVTAGSRRTGRGPAEKGLQPGPAHGEGAAAMAVYCW